MAEVESRLVKIETTQDEHTRLLTEIRDQARLTNGSVADLKQWKARLDGAKAAMDWVKPLLIATVSGGVVAVIAALSAH